MSAGFLLGLAAAVTAILGARVLTRSLPLHRSAVAMTVTDAVWVALGLAGLAFHCGAMFFPSEARMLPGAGAVMRQIDALGTASVVWFSVPALLVLVGLRHQHPIGLAVATLSLAAVGVTMYDGGPLAAHLMAIFAAVVVLAGVAATLVRPPRRRDRLAEYGRTR